MEESRWINHEGLIRRDEGEVGVITRRDRALTREPRKSDRAFRHPARNIY